MLNKTVKQTVKQKQTLIQTDKQTNSKPTNNTTKVLFEWPSGIGNIENGSLT